MQTLPLHIAAPHPFTNIFFDCDGTLSLIEGIDFLAEINDVGSSVRCITERSMADQGISSSIYEKRLNLIKTHQQDIEELKCEYLRHIAPEAGETIALLQGMKKKVHIISAGIQAAILPLAAHLNIPGENVHAVNLSFTENGDYDNFDRASPLITPFGKKIIIEKINRLSMECVLIGDGANDLAASSAVTRFIGYGGAHHHNKIMQEADFFLLKSSFSALLPLLLTETEANHLNKMDRELYQKGLLHIQQEGLLIQGERYVHHSLSG